MKRICKAVALLALASASVVHAHQDAILTLLPNGVISGLPAQFAVPRLNIDGLGTRNPRVALVVGNRVSTILPCATRVLKSLSMEDVQVSGSWYHDEKSLPYYISVKFLDPWRSPDPAERSSYDFLFNLRTGELMDATRSVWEGNWVRTAPRPFPHGCAIATSEMRPNTSLERTRER